MIAHEFAEDDDGTLHGMLVHVQAPDRITVWTGLLDAGAARKPSMELEAQDFSARSVVHFIAWEQARSYYAGSRYAPMIDGLKKRMLRFSTLPPSLPSGDAG